MLMSGRNSLPCLPWRPVTDFLSFRFSSKFPGLKNRVALKLFTVLKYFLFFRTFEELALALKNRVYPEIFHCIEIFFNFQDFWGTYACPENRVCHDIFTVCIYFLHSGCLSNFCLPWKTECALNSLHWICICITQNFEQFALALKNRVALKFFTVLNIFYHSGFLSNLCLPWKTECALNSLYWIYIFYHSEFWTTCACP